MKLPATCLCCLLLASTIVLRADGDTPADPDLPQPFNPSASLSSLGQSPFSRVVSFEDTYLLTGIAYVDGKPIVTLMNKDTKKRFVVTGEPNAEGWQLAQASVSEDMRLSEATLLYGGEEITLHYTDVLQMPEHGKGSRKDSSRHREVTPVNIHQLSEKDWLRKDKDGKTYVRGSIYLPTADRERYYNSMSSEARDKFNDVMREQGERMLKYTPDQRAAYAKKVFDKVESAGRSK